MAVCARVWEEDRAAGIEVDREGWSEKVVGVVAS